MAGGQNPVDTGDGCTQVEYKVVKVERGAGSILADGWETLGRCRRAEGRGDEGPHGALHGKATVMERGQAMMRGTLLKGRAAPSPMRPSGGGWQLATHSHGDQQPS